MATQADGDTGLGFDIDVARRRLTDWLVNEGVVAESQLQAWLSEWRQADPVRADATPEEANWAVAWDAAFVHVQLHGVEATVNGVEHAQCSASKCRKLAVSLALWEIHAYYVEHAGDGPGIADDLVALGALLEQAHARIGKALATKAINESHRYVALAGPVRSPDHPPWAECVHLADTIRSCAQLSTQLAEQVRDGFVSSSLRRRRVGRGRSKQTLLTSVWQHLFHGGFDAREVGRLVPDADRVRDEDDLVHRVRTRVKGDDCRSFEAPPPGL